MNSFSFLERLNDKRAEGIKNDITRFISVEFEEVKYGESSEKSKKIQEFISEKIQDFSKIFLLNFSEENSDYDEICDGIEAIITKALYLDIFCNTFNEKQEDFDFEEKVNRLYFISPKHLDIPDSVIQEEFLQFAFSKLNQLNQYRTPKDKSNTIINFCNVISSMISEYKKNKPFGVDDIYPVVVYAIIKAKISKLKSNLRYIQLYRHNTRLESDEDYYFTTLSSAIGYIEELNLEKLSMNRDELLNVIQNDDYRVKEKYRKLANKSISEESSEEKSLISFLSANQYQLKEKYDKITREKEKHQFNKKNKVAVKGSEYLYSGVSPLGFIGSTIFSDITVQSELSLFAPLFDYNTESVLSEYYPLSYMSETFNLSESRSFNSLTNDQRVHLFNEMRKLVSIISNIKLSLEKYN